MNSPSLTAERDPGHDGIASADPNRHFAADASAYGLQYHLQDYTPVVPTAPDPLPALTGVGLLLHFTERQLYNGNIPVMYSGMRDTDGERLPQLARLFTYDQLNRLRTSVSYQPLLNDATTYHNVNPVPTWNTNYGYDANGNLKHLHRYDQNGAMIDQLGYTYADAGNPDRLTALTEYANPSADENDLEQLAGDNAYTYTARGELATEHWADIGAARWTQAGKLARIERDAQAINNNYKDDLAFAYDAAGHRVTKTSRPRNTAGVLQAEPQWETTIYIRDAQGACPQSLQFGRLYLGLRWYELENASNHHPGLVGFKPSKVKFSEIGAKHRKRVHKAFRKSMRDCICVYFGFLQLSNYGTLEYIRYVEYNRVWLCSCIGLSDQEY